MRSLPGRINGSGAAVSLRLSGDASADFAALAGSPDFTGGQTTNHMKTSFHSLRATDLLGMGALLAFAGCASAPLRQSTTSLESEYDPSAYQLGSSGFVAPAALQTVAPVYPWDMRRMGFNAVVNVDCIIDETGKVIDAQVTAPNDKEFDEAALVAVKRWTFKPGSQDGVAVKTRVNIPIQFSLYD